MLNFIKSYLSPDGDVSSKRVNVFLVLGVGLVLCCIPAAAGTGLALVGIAITGGVAGRVSEGRRGQTTK